jgi:GDP-L-fucose synthase
MMKENSKIYIAGHRGMVGSSLMRILQSKGYTNIVTRLHSELNLTRQTEVENFFEKERPEYVFLAAAKVGGILANDTYKAEFIYDNIMIAVNVIHSSYIYGVKKLLNLGSSCIYPKFAPQPMREDALLTGSLEPTNEPYAIAKIAALKLCRYYNEQYRTNYICVMPTNLYGPFDNFNLETSHVFAALIRKFYLAKLLRCGDFRKIRKDIERYSLGFGLDKEVMLDSEESLISALKKIGVTEDHVLIWGTGEVYREFLCVDDLAGACVFLMENINYQDIGEFVNIGTGAYMKINELADIIKGIAGFEGKIKHDPSKPDGTPRKHLDVNKIRRLSWEPKISFEEGIKKTYDWYCNRIIMEE